MAIKYNTNSSEKRIWIYELYYYPNKTHVPGSEIVFYRGTVDNIHTKTLRNCAKRLDEHKRDAATGGEAKYEFIRNKVWAKDYEFHLRIIHEYLLGEPWDKTYSERWWVIDGIRRGYQLQNMKHGDLQDPHFLEQLDDIDIKTEEHFIRDSKLRKKQPVTTSKYERAVDAYLNLNAKKMKVKAEIDEQANIRQSVIDKLDDQVSELEHKQATIEQAIQNLQDERDKIYASIKAEVMSDRERDLVKLEDAIEKATGFRKSYDTSAFITYHESQLKALAEKYAELSPEDGSKLLPYVEALDDFKAKPDTSERHVNVVYERKRAWREYFDLENRMKVFGK